MVKMGTGSVHTCGMIKTYSSFFHGEKDDIGHLCKLYMYVYMYACVCLYFSTVQIQTVYRIKEPMLFRYY